MEDSRFAALMNSPVWPVQILHLRGWTQRSHRSMPDSREFIKANGVMRQEERAKDEAAHRQLISKKRIGDVPG